jgi:DNA-binding winged helix-turn-helix (wHTH) protein
VNRSFGLGDWLVEPALNRLSRGAEVVQLEPRAMDLLVFLARRPGEVLSRETLIDGVWQTRFVGEAVLRNTVAALRRALGDRADSPGYIETISKRGYRLIAEVKGAGLPQAEPTPGLTFKLIWEDTEVPLAEGANLIGRDEDATVRIDSPEVSRRHARLSVAGGVVTLEDLGSKNGTYRNGRRLEALEQLADGDEIWIGLNLARMRLRVEDERTRTERGRISGRRPTPPSG